MTTQVRALFGALYPQSATVTVPDPSAAPTSAIKDPESLTPTGIRFGAFFPSTDDTGLFVGLLTAA